MNIFTSTYSWIQKDCGSEIIILKISKDFFWKKKMNTVKHSLIEAWEKGPVSHQYLSLPKVTVSETVYKSIEKKMSILAEWYFALKTSEKDKVHLFLNFSFITISITWSKDIHAYHQEKIFDKENDPLIFCFFHPSAALLKNQWICEITWEKKKRLLYLLYIFQKLTDVIHIASLK